MDIHPYTCKLVKTGKLLQTDQDTHQLSRVEDPSPSVPSNDPSACCLVHLDQALSMDILCGLEGSGTLLEGCQERHIVDWSSVVNWRKGQTFVSKID